MGESPSARMSSSMRDRASAARASNCPPSTWVSSTVKSRGRGLSLFTRRSFQSEAESSGSGVGAGEAVGVGCTVRPA